MPKTTPPAGKTKAPARVPRGKRRCKNCDDVFTPNREWQEFCTPNCKKNFWRAGGVSIGRMRPVLAEMVAAQVAEAVQAINARLEAIDARLQKQERR